SEQRLQGRRHLGAMVAQVELRLGGVGWMAGQRVVHRTAQRVNVGSGAGGALVLGLFRGQVFRGASPFSQTGDGDVDDADRTWLARNRVRHEQVRWLDRQMNEALLVDVFQGQGGLPQELTGAVDGQRSLL